jgi:hypothetical protein
MRLSYVLFMAFGCLLAGLRAAEAPLTLPAAAQAHLAAGSKVIKMATGDLNADGQADLVFVGEATDPKKITKRDDGYEQNSNTRTIVVLLAEKEGYRKVCESAKFIPPAYTPGVRYLHGPFRSHADREGCAHGQVRLACFCWILDEHGDL